MRKEIDISVGIEPDLNSLMRAEFSLTWGDKKAQCQREGREAWRNGEYSLLDNPYNEGTWPNKWWRDEYELSCGNAQTKG